MNDWNRMIVVYFEDGTFGPDENKESKLRSFFENVNQTNGGEIEKLNLNRNNANQAFIYFKEKEVAERVAKQRNIRIGSYKFNVKLSHLYRRPIIIDGNNIGMRFFFLSISTKLTLSIPVKRKRGTNVSDIY